MDSDVSTWFLATGAEPCCGTNLACWCHTHILGWAGGGEGAASGLRDALAAGPFPIL
jgi:hypothetical protein